MTSKENPKEEQRKDKTGAPQRSGQERPGQEPRKADQPGQKQRKADEPGQKKAPKRDV